MYLRQRTGSYIAIESPTAPVVLKFRVICLYASRPMARCFSFITIVDNGFGRWLGYRNQYDCECHSTWANLALFYFEVAFFRLLRHLYTALSMTRPHHTDADVTAVACELRRGRAPPCRFAGNAQVGPSALPQQDGSCAEAVVLCPYTRACSALAVLCLILRNTQSISMCAPCEASPALHFTPVDGRAGLRNLCPGRRSFESVTASLGFGTSPSVSPVKPAAL